MAIRIRRQGDLLEAEARELRDAFAAYYSAPPADYYSIADRALGRYTPEELPFHYDLAQRVERGMTVLEVGCGSAHLCAEVQGRGGHYIGMDYSAELLEKNRARYPGARFVPISATLPEQFDLVASLYTIEHVVDPPAYLERMWSACKPGGLMAVICPEFIECEGFPQSVYYGSTPRRLRDKVRSLSLADAARHALEVAWLAPRWKAAARRAAPGAFWINTRPAVLHGAPYTIDADAVHLSTLRDLTWWFEQRSATVVATSQSLPEIPDAILAFNCYILVRKAAHGKPL